MEGEDLRALERVWYQKLKDEGFEDIEDTSKSYRPLKICDSIYFGNQYVPTEFEIKQSYYELAASLLHTHPFKDRRDEEIWKMHSEGLPIAKISEILNQIGFQRNQKIFVFEVIKRLRREMGVY